MTTKTNLHPIVEYFSERLLPNSSLIDEQLNGLLNVGKSILDGRAEAIFQARKIKENGT